MQASKSSRCSNKKKAHKQSPSNKDQSNVTKASPIYGLDPFLDDNGLLRVRGQLRNSILNWNLMHSILLPQRSVNNKQDH